MSSNDKTRQKLMESMRKTKKGATKNIPAAESETKSKPAKATSKKKNVSTKKEAAKAISKAKPDPYQSARRRVWPD